MQRTFAAALAAVFVILLTGPVHADVNTQASADFEALLDEVWESNMANFPTFASSLGDRRFNTEWTDQSLRAIAARHDENRQFLARLYEMERNALDTNDQLNYELFRRKLENDVDGHQFNRHLLPFSHRGGVQTLNQTSARLRLTNVQDYEDWLSRMHKIDRPS